MSNNLDLSQVASNQNQKEVTINDQSGQLDAALTEILEVDLSAGNVVLTDLQFRRNMVFDCNDHTVPRTLTIPAIKRGVFMVHNHGTNIVSVVRGAVSIDIPAGEIAIFTSDGTTDGLVRAASSSVPGIYDLAVYVSGAPTDLELVLRLAIARTFTLPVDLTGSQAKAKTAATGAVSFEIQRNSTAIGTINFAGGATTGTFTFTSEIDFAVGDIFEIFAPATADATLADISFTLIGTR